MMKADLMGKIISVDRNSIIMIWYKENTETVERISVVQS